MRAVTLHRSVAWLLPLALAGCQSGGMGWAGWGWNRTPPYSRATTTPPANAYAGPQLPSTQATPQTLQGNPYSQDPATAGTAATPQGPYPGAYPGQPTSFDGSSAYGQGTAPAYPPASNTPGGTSYSYNSAVQPQQGYYDSTYPPPAHATNGWQRDPSKQNWASQQAPANPYATDPGTRPPYAGAALPGESAYAGAYEPPAAYRTADARAAVPGTSRYDLGSRYNTGSAYSAPTASSAPAGPPTSATSSLSSPRAWDNTAGSSNAARPASPRRGTAWEDSTPTARAGSAPATSDQAPDLDAFPEAFGERDPIARTATAQAGTLSEPWQPGNNGYQPGDNGYQPPATNRYQSPATAYQTPGRSDAPPYRPGGTGDYEPSGIAGRGVTARRPVRISPAELEQEGSRPESPSASYPRTSAAEEDGLPASGSYPRR